MDNIWNSVECHAWSRGFDYQGYLSMIEHIDDECYPVSCTTYRLLCAAFENTLEENK
jgi:hypothetical protein